MCRNISISKILITFKYNSLIQIIARQLRGLFLSNCSRILRAKPGSCQFVKLASWAIKRAGLKIHDGAPICKLDILFLSGSGGSNPLPRILRLCSIVASALDKKYPQGLGTKLNLTGKGRGCNSPQRLFVSEQNFKYFN